MIALLIGYESISRIFAPVPIHFVEAIPIACLGLAVNIASAWLLSGGGHHHHGHSHGPTHDGNDHDEPHHLKTGAGVIVLEVFEDGVPPRFRLRAETGPVLLADAATIETVRPDGDREQFTRRLSKRFLSPMHSWRMCVSARTIIPSFLLNMNTRTDWRTATTIYAPP
jgi:Co/Zn/Cd efflux system component